MWTLTGSLVGVAVLCESEDLDHAFKAMGLCGQGKFPRGLNG